MAAVETVIIETENGPVLINKSDFDDSKHKLFGQKEAEPEKAEEPKPAKGKGKGKGK
jgi:hypothetical protein